MPTPAAIAIIDGHYCAYRFFFGMPGLNGPGGRPTGVTFAFAKLARQLRHDPVFTHWVCVFDHREPSFRHTLFADYKAHRDPMPEDLRVQLPDVEELLKASGVPVLAVPGFEADDAVATLAQTAAAAGLDVRLLTKDKDVDQVLSERIRTWDTTKDLLRGPEQLLAEKGIRPDQVVDYLSMIGDTSDNVPGIYGVGPKTAAKLLAQYGTMESVLAHVDDLKGKLQENVRAFIPKAEFTRKLITLVTVPDLPPLDQFQVKREVPIDLDVYARFGFDRSRFQPPATAATATAPLPVTSAVPASAKALESGSYRVLATADLPELAERLRAAGRFALDTETTGLDPLSADLVGLSLAWGEADGHGAVYLPVRGLGHELVPLAAIREVLGPVLTDATVKKVGQNLKYDWRVLFQHGLEVAGYDGDTMLASWLIDPARESHGIDFLAQSLLHEEKIATSQVIDLAGGQTMAEVEIATVARYACEDAQVCWRLAQLLEAQLAEQGLLAVYRDQEVPIAVLIGRMEHAGMAVDRSALATIQRHLEDYLTQVTAEIRKHAGADFNPASPKQVAEVLFTKLKLPVISKNKTGPSTDAETLAALRHHHELPDLLLQHRQLSKLISAYLVRLPDYINPLTQAIHTNLKQTGTETGRIASDGPNLQAIPKRRDLGREMRSAFIARPGTLLIAADYSQIELRILAHLSQDPTLIEAFRAGRDIHRFVAAQANGVAEDAVSPAQRNAAKAINFGIIYGQTAFGLAGQLGISRGDAQRFIDDYFNRFATVLMWKRQLLADAKGRGYVVTMGGRRRYVPGLASTNRNEVLAAERVALNSTIQGSASDLIKQAMLRLAAHLPAGCRPLLQIHDELLIEAPEAVADAAAAGLTTAMAGAWTLSVPLTAEARIGRNWLEVG